MKQFLKTFWEKFGVFSLTKEGANLQITVNYPFASGFVIGAITGVVLW